MSKTLCKKGISERIEKDKEAKYKCKKCGGLVSKEKYVCKPKKL